MPFGPQGFDVWEFLRGVNAIRKLLRRPPARDEAASKETIPSAGSAQRQAGKNAREN